MIFVDQTRFGYPDGNCYSACLASILEAPLGTVPDFHDPGEPREQPGWRYRVNQYLDRWGLWCLVVHVGDDSVIPPDAITILSGGSPRGDFMHSVVGQGLQIIHDPHPTRAGLRGTWKDWEVELLIPKRITPRIMEASSLSYAGQPCRRCGDQLLRLNNQCPNCGEINL